MKSQIPDLPSIHDPSAVLETCLLKNDDHRFLLQARFSELAAKLDYHLWQWPKTPEQIIAY